MALGLARITGEAWQVMVLAMAPGSVTEMALTAKVLQEGIAVVTAFHLVRIFIILPFAPLIISVTRPPRQKRAARRRAGQGRVTKPRRPKPARENG